MRMRRPRKGFIKRMSPQLKQELLNVLTRVIGETIKDKMARAILIGLISTAGSYTSDDIAPIADPPALIQAPQNNTP